MLYDTSDCSQYTSRKFSFRKAVRRIKLLCLDLFRVTPYFVPKSKRIHKSCLLLSNYHCTVCVWVPEIMMIFYKVAIYIILWRIICPMERPDNYIDHGSRCFTIKNTRILPIIIWWSKYRKEGHVVENLWSALQNSLYPRFWNHVPPWIKLFTRHSINNFPISGQSPYWLWWFEQFRITFYFSLLSRSDNEDIFWRRDECFLLWNYLWSYRPKFEEEKS